VVPEGRTITAANILIVEDDPIISSVIEFRLKKMGFNVVGKVQNEAGALQSIASCCPDLILMDIHLEGDDDGITVAKKISETRKIPLVYLTAYTDDETLKRAKDTGPSGFIVKPFTDNALRVSIEMAIDKKTDPGF
jgi:CheY-like chemotaxis protein